MSKINTLARCLLASTFIVCCSQSAAQSGYPNKPVRLVIGTGAGSGQDVVGRMLADKMAPLLKATFIVDNKPGASGRIASDYVAKSAPDGYTMLLGGYNSHVLLPAIVPNLPYDPIKDFTPIGSAATASFLVVGTKDLRANNLKELIALASSKPGLQYGTSGNGSTGHFCAELLNQKKHLRMEHVPYKSPVQVATDLMGGQVNLAFLDIATAGPMVKSGRLKALGSCVTRSAGFPDVGSYEDEGIDIDGRRVSPPMQAFFFPAATPKPIVDKVAVALKAVLAQPDVQARLNELGNVPTFETGEQLRANLISDGIAWKALAQRVGITVE